MTLRQTLAWRYGLVTALAILLLAGMAYHELVTGPAQRRNLGIAELPETAWSEFFELFAYGMIPLLLGGGWWLMRRTLAPLDALAEQLKSTSGRNLRQPLPRSHNGDELDRLAESFNSLTARLDESFQQTRLFTLHASHELKTPLTVMWLQLGTLLQDAGTLSLDQRESLECQLNEVQRLSRIVDSLTLLTKADSGQVLLERRPVPLADLVREAFEDAQVLAERNEVQVRLGQCDDVRFMGDRDRLRQLLLNLVDNAIKYNCPGGLVELSLRCAAGQVELQVANTGQGIPPELRARLFQRFVRGDEARSKAIEGCGLGLSICQWIAQAHGGTVEVESELGKMTRFAVRWPLPQPEPALSA